MSELGLFELVISRLPPSEELSRLLTRAGAMLHESIGSESGHSCAVSGDNDAVLNKDVDQDLDGDEGDVADGIRAGLRG